MGRDTPLNFPAAHITTARRTHNDAAVLLNPNSRPHPINLWQDDLEDLIAILAHDQLL